MSDLAVTGRPKTSPVWDYFSYDESAKKSKCEVITNVVTKTKCAKTFSGKFSTNLKLHLKSSHREAYDEVIKKEKQNKEKENEKKSCTRANAACNFSMESNQPQITTFLKRPKLYNNEDPKCKAITKKLSIFLTASSTPISLVEDPTFSSLITELDSRYSRYMMSKKIDEVLIDLKGNVLSHMLQARKVNFCTDIWSKKRMTASFIGVTAHFFASHKRHNVTLAVKRMPSPHTGEEVVKIVLQVFKDWNIPDHKIGSIITDNGSNMVKAFKILQLQQKENMQSEGDDEEDFELCDTDNVDVLDTGSLDDSLPDQEKTIEESHQQDMYEQEREFDENEFEHEIAFVGYRRLSCFAHSLQLVVSKFDECSVFRHTIKKAKNIVSKFNKSTKATEKLIGNTGLKLLGDCPTRWSSTYLLINRFLTVKASVIQVLDEHSWDGLQNSEWRVLENIQELLQPFAEYTTLCSGEEYTTISSVVPIVVELQYHLEEMSTKPGMATISKRLNNELKSRFDKYVNPSAAGFDVYYLVATFLDPKQGRIQSLERGAAPC
ncbi:E3 SUMO-protein ligase ZBED1-like [Dysidea avara]|uniref:E3 SUMO-protein ligase ZBED1-like n=1 Tax=Dysidea avara TaxID=196820 RepID=UPI00331B20F7